MKVVHLNTHASGGSYEYAVLLSTALAEQGIESNVLCKSPENRPLLDRIIRRSYVSLSTEPWHGTRRLLSPPAPADLAEVDVVHLHVIADWFDIPGWLETLPCRIGLVIGLHGMWHVTGGCFLYRGCNRYATERHACDPCPILRWPANRFLAAAAFSRKLRAYQDRRARFVANSRWLAGLAQQSPIVRASGAVRVIPPGVDTAVFKPQDKNVCRKNLGLPAAAFVIVTGATSLTDANKNVPWLLEQLSHLPELQKVIVLVFGEGTAPVPAGLNVRFTGGVRDRRHLSRLYAAADVFVSASLMETYGLTLVEAMACGTPVVAFRIGGIPESVPDEQVGLLCTPHDGRELLGAVEKLRSSTQVRQKFGSAASELVLTRNAKNQFGAAFAQIYRDCLERITADVNNQLVVRG